MFKFSLATLVLITGINLSAEDKPKRTFKNDGVEVYNVLPENATSFGDAFKKGMFYGRVRTNMFKWDWDKEIDGSQLNHKAHGVGGSLIYKTAPLNGVSATLGVYHTSSPIDSLNMNKDEVKYVKAGKDTFSRYGVLTDGKWGITSLAQAYFQYNVAKTDIKIGRQIYESLLTNSNDTKMIPNTFEGVSVTSKDFANTVLAIAYFDKQKLRDHSTFHDVITFGDGKNNWNNNDDSGVHQGLSFKNFVSANKETSHDLWILSMNNKSISNLVLDVTYGAVPDVTNYLIAEANYAIKLANGFSLTPGIRYFSQFDDGGGKVGGASLSGKLVKWKDGLATYENRGYKNPDSLDTSLIAARIVAEKGEGKFQLSYSKVADEADIVAPWRAFPTGGYGRAMAQTNWIANTETWAIEGFYDFGKAKLIPGFRGMVRYAMQDFDDKKADAQADSNIIHIDLWQKFKSIENLEAKVRLGLVDASEGAKTDVSYNEYRLEFNYLF